MAQWAVVFRSVVFKSVICASTWDLMNSSVDPPPASTCPLSTFLTPPVNLYPNLFLCLKFVIVTSCSRCVEKHGIHVKLIRNPSSVLIFLLELLLVHYLQHLVKYLKTMCQSSPPTPILPSSFSRNYSRKEQQKLVKHSILCCTVLYCVVLHCTVLYYTALYCTILY